MNANPLSVTHLFLRPARRSGRLFQRIVGGRIIGSRILYLNGQRFFFSEFFFKVPFFPRSLSTSLFGTCEEY